MNIHSILNRFSNYSNLESPKEDQRPSKLSKLAHDPYSTILSFLTFNELFSVLKVNKHSNITVKKRMATLDYNNLKMMQALRFSKIEKFNLPLHEQNMEINNPACSRLSYPNPETIPDLVQTLTLLEGVLSCQCRKWLHYYLHLNYPQNIDEDKIKESEEQEFQLTFHETRQSTLMILWNSLHSYKPQNIVYKNLIDGHYRSAYINNNIFLVNSYIVGDMGETIGEAVKCFKIKPNSDKTKCEIQQIWSENCHEMTEGFFLNNNLILSSRDRVVSYNILEENLNESWTYSLPPQYYHPISMKLVKAFPSQNFAIFLICPKVQGEGISWGSDWRAKEYYVSAINERRLKIIDLIHGNILKTIPLSSSYGIDNIHAFADKDFILIQRESYRDGRFPGHIFICHKTDNKMFSLPQYYIPEPVSKLQHIVKGIPNPAEIRNFRITYEKNKGEVNAKMEIFFSKRKVIIQSKNINIPGKLRKIFCCFFTR